MEKKDSTQKCYNSFSCIGAILIIIFVLGSIVWDICFTKPAMRDAIEEIRTEVKDIHSELNQKISTDSAIQNKTFYIESSTDSVK